MQLANWLLGRAASLGAITTFIRWSPPIQEHIHLVPVTKLIACPPACVQGLWLAQPGGQRLDAYSG